MSGPVVSNSQPTEQLLGKDGRLTFAWLKWFQNIGRVINIALNQNGQIITTVAPGVIVASTDNITDGTGRPLAGGKEAYTALVTSGPTTGDVLEWNGSAWLPAPLPPPPAAPVTQIIAGTNVTIFPPSGLGNVTINATAGSGTVLTATASIAVGSGGGSTTQFVPIAGGIANTSAFVQQLQAPGIPFTGASTGFLVSLDAVEMSFVAGGMQLGVTTTPPAGCTFTAGSYSVNIKAIQ